MARWLISLLKRLACFLWREEPNIKETPDAHEVRYRFSFHEDRAIARKAAEANGVIAIVASGSVQKWAQMSCPCGCGEILMLNLMHSHDPRWDVISNDDGTHSLSPSIDSTSCGAHFLIRRDRLIWCE